MPFYKNTLNDNDIHWLDSTSDAHYLPAGCIEITEYEAHAILKSKETIPEIPIKISARQFRAALNQLNIRNAVETAVSTGDWGLKDWYQYTQTFDRTDQTTINMLTLLNINNDINNIWVLGNTL